MMKKDYFFPCREKITVSTDVKIICYPMIIIAIISGIVVAVFQDFLHKMGFTTNEFLQIVVCSACIVLTFNIIVFFNKIDNENNIENNIKSINMLAIFIGIYFILITVFLFLKFSII